MFDNNFSSTETSLTRSWHKYWRRWGVIKLSQKLWSHRKVGSLKDKLQVFVDYYRELYDSSSEDLGRQFPEQVDIPVFIEEHKQDLDRDITASVLEVAIQQMKLGKSPGLDGLTVEFYRTFKEIPPI